jgi:imidazoleglycerol-phosphate dehydratase/histidinol-phosphatase
MTSRKALVTLDALLAPPSNSGPASSAPLLALAPRVLASLERIASHGFSLLLLVPDDASARSAALTLQALCASQGVSLAATSTFPPGGLQRALQSALAGANGVLIARAPADESVARAAGVAFHCTGQNSNTADWPSIAAALTARRATIDRATKETRISGRVDLDATSPIRVRTGIGFFDHMLEQIAKHGGFALELQCEGDLHIDEHHTIEDCALALGDALRRALDNKLGIARYGFLLPMDEAEAQVSIDLSGRAYAVFEGRFGRESVGGLPTELVPHFFRSLAESLGAAIHVSVRGENTHHMIEACFKGVGRSLRQAFRREGAELPSTKGTL